LCSGNKFEFKIAVNFKASGVKTRRLLVILKQMNDKQLFSAYSDESGTFDHRFQSIAIVSGEEDIINELRRKLQNELNDKKIYEVKFSEITGYQSPRAEVARQFINFAVKDFANYKRIRIDILTWDIQDSRHNIPNIDNVNNLQIMYYKVLEHMAGQWKEIRWNFYPDTNSKVNWNEIIKYLNLRSSSHLKLKQPTLINLLQDNQRLQFHKVEPLDSVKEPLVQLADLFAGMARFSGEECPYCVQWLFSFGGKNQLKLQTVRVKHSKSQSTRIKECRYQLIGELDNICKSCRLGVSLRTKKRLWTPNRTNPINFWIYEPKGDYDKAPIKIMN